MPRKRKKTATVIGIELLQSNFVVNNTTKLVHASKVKKILDKAMPLLHAREGAQAETLFRKALTLEPLKPDVLYNLAQALEMQGLENDSLSISEALLILFPDYLFARTALAHAAILDYDYEDALDLLMPLFSRRKFHISEFNALCATVVELSLLTQKYDSAHTWLHTWSQTSPDHPQLNSYRKLLQKVEDVGENV